MDFFYKILCSCDIIFEIKYLHSYPLPLPKQKKKKDDAIQVTLNMTFCPTPQTLTHQQPKHPQRTTINKIKLAAFP